MINPRFFASSLSFCHGLLVLAGSACLWHVPLTAHGLTRELTLSLVTPSPDINTLDTTVTFRQGGGANSDTQPVELSGRVFITLEINNHPTNPTVKEMTITGGDIDFSNSSFTLVGNAFPIAIPVSFSNQAGRPQTIAPPTQVSVPQGTFEASGQQITFTSGAAQIDLPLPLGSQDIDLSDPPLTIMPIGEGMFTFTPQVPAGDRAAWLVEMNLPINMSQRIFEASSLGVTVDVDMTGQLRAAREFTLPNLSRFVGGDATLDGNVDAADLNVLALHWQENTGAWTDADFTGNGIVDAADLNELAMNWPSGVSGSSVIAPQSIKVDTPDTALAAAVPEPSVAVVVTMLGLTWLAGRRENHHA